ncbi:PHP domain-containing protein [Clostridium sp. LBM24168]
MYKKGDFHLHSSESDGKFSPKDLVSLAKIHNLDIISVTDHDTISGLKESISQSVSIGIKVIPGIELSTLYKGKSVHVLGYFNTTNTINSNFKNFLQEMNNYRLNRAKKIIDNLYKFFNIKLDYTKVLKNAHGVIARPHIAKAIIDAGYNYSFDYIFSKFIGENSPAYIPNKKLTTEDGISLLKSIGAMTVLAHPVLIRGIDVEEVIKLPFDGIEAIYVANTQEDTLRFINYANEYHKIISAGSDFHGMDSSDSKHATYPGQVYLEEDRIELFLRKLNSI